MPIRRTKKIGVTWIAAGLTGARMAAGYKSGRAAALAHGWVESSYRAHESATRKISEPDAEMYEKAFAIPKGTLLRNPGSLSGDLKARRRELAEEEWELRKRAGCRLRLARFVRGFGSGEKAAEHFGLNRATLAGHEFGANAMSAAVLEMYGEAFAVNPLWLADGRLPSGLGPEVDRRLVPRRIYWDPAEGTRLSHFAEGANLPPRGRIQNLLKAIKQKRPSAPDEAHDAVWELSPQAAFEQRTNMKGESKARQTARRWSLPKGLLTTTLESRVADVVVVVVDRPGLPFRPGDRLFVDTTKTDPKSPGRYARVTSSGDLQIEEGGSSKKGAAIKGSIVVGKIVSAFCRQ